MIKKIWYIFRQCWHLMVSFFPWYVSLYKGKRWYTKTAIGVMSFFVGFFLYLGMVDINFLWLFGKSPGFYQIATPPTYDASEVYSADSVLIGRYYKENRTPVRYEEVDSSFWHALIDTEDERFYDHHGIDFTGLGGAVKDAVLHHDARGASTITQQLAKNLFRVRSQYSGGLLGKIPGIRMLIMKSKEWIIAIKLESIYSKNAILTMYANTVDFGNNSFGIKTAAKTYFNTTPNKLTPEQSAVLVGMLKATTYYNPITKPQNSLKRRNQVLAKLESHHHLSHDDYIRLIAQPIKLDVNTKENYDGKCQYFREYVAKYLKKNMENADDYDLYTSGLRIYTTIDTRMQKYAEEAVTKQMRQVQRNFRNHWGNEDPWRDENGQLVPNFIENILHEQPFYKELVAKYPNQPDSIAYYCNKPHKVRLFDYEKGEIYENMSSVDSIKYMVKFMHASMVAMEPQTGAVRAWVGDVDFNTWKYDKVTTPRQPGSTFKLFVYTEAMNQGLTPCDKRRDEFISMQVLDKKTGQETTWTPTNANGYFTGDSIPLKMAFAQSINSVAVRLGQQMGITNIIKTAQQMGIKSPLVDEPSLALGSSDVTLLEMTNSYCTVANNGSHHEPVLVTKVIDSEGNVIYEAPEDTNKVLTDKVAFFMQQMLKAGVQDAGGTSMPLDAYIDKNTDWGGKTGTSNNHSDAWFMGVSPNLVVGAWVGGEYRCIHFRTGALGQGSRTALPIVGLFIQKLMSDPRYKRYRARWKRPVDLDIDPSSYECNTYYPTRHSNDISNSEDYQTDAGEMEEGIDADQAEGDYLQEGEDLVKSVTQSGNNGSNHSQGKGNESANGNPTTNNAASTTRHAHTSSSTSGSQTNN